MPKQKYLCIQRSQSGKGEKPSPAKMEEMYSRFNAWKEKFQGNIVDMGGKLKGGGKIVTSEGATDGPFVEAKEVVGGYMIVSADSIEEAMEIARQSPGVWMPGSSVEVREITTP
ncbi:MAG: YciI family protein [Terriglobales bacterium]